MLLASSVFLCFAYFLWYQQKFRSPMGDVYKSSVNKSLDEFNRLKDKAASLKEFAITRGYNKETCFLVDMNVASGKNRFFVYDLANDSVILEGLVAHGSCDRSFLLNPLFSNTKECGCSSAGKYKIGAGYKGRFGKAYKLYGLDSSNSNAFSRNIVLHSYDCVPEQETDPIPICNSRGCAMTSPGFLKKLESFINHSKKPVLLWIFE
jgi:hypothetical protein